MNEKYKNLIDQINKMQNDSEGIYDIRLVDKRLEHHVSDTDESVFFSRDKTVIICKLYYADSVDEMANKLIKAESMCYECLAFKRYRQNSPDLIEALIYNVQKFNNNI